MNAVERPEAFAPAPDVLPGDVSFITTEAALRALHPPMMSRAEFKVMPTLDRHCRSIIAAAPFVVMATQGPSGADVSPRGDPPGFVRALDDGHLLLPDRIGNNRFDGYVNLLTNPAIGLLFIVPGMAEVLRVNGTARITDDARLLAPSSVQGKPPRVGLLITVTEAFIHCAKAVNRAKLWDPSRFIDRASLPSYGDMLADMVPGLTRDESERQGAEMARRGMY